MNTRTKAILAIVAALAGSAMASPVNGVYLDGPDCDINGPRQAVEEIGTVIFPADELVATSSSQTTLSSCLTDDPTLSNFLITMTNLTGKDWTDLFYVADVETTISNADGEAASAVVPGTRTLAFRIDSVGSNTPLVFESMGSNGIFEAGETWQFILQDYTNAAGGPPEAFSSFDFAGASTAFPGITDSTGSIVQFLVPAPSSVALLGLGGMMTLRRRR
jgi:hypothetical protein